MSSGNVTVNDYGWALRLTVKKEGEILDISSYTSLQFVFHKPSTEELIVTAEFTTDGSDGQLEYVIADGDIDEVGAWRVRTRLGKSGVEINSTPVQFFVRNRR